MNHTASSRRYGAFHIATQIVVLTASHPSWLSALLSQGGRPAKFSVCRTVRDVLMHVMCLRVLRDVSSYSSSLPSPVSQNGSGRGTCV